MGLNVKKIKEILKCKKVVNSGRMLNQRGLGGFAGLVAILVMLSVLAGAGILVSNQSSGVSDLTSSVIEKVKEVTGAWSPSAEAKDKPVFLSGSIEPMKVAPGDEVTVTVELKDDYGIEKVTADMGGIETIELEAIEQYNNGTIEVWQGKWLAHGTEIKNYQTMVYATNVLGKQATMSINWEDPTITDSFTDTSYIAATSSVIVDTSAGQVKLTGCAPGHTDNGDGTCTGTWQVGASSDDAYRRWTPSDWSLTGELIAGSPDVTVNQAGAGMRFTNITIPQAQTIDSAYLTFRRSRVRTVTTVNTRISAEDVDDAPTFADDSAAFDTRWANRTTARVDWDGIGDWSDDLLYNSPEIKTVIKEIVDREGWVSGQDIVIFWEDFDDRSTHVWRAERYAHSYESLSTHAPKLVITYTPSYPASGTLTSTNLLDGETVSGIDSFGYNASSIPPGTYLKTQFSQDDTNWKNSASTPDGWDTQSEGSNSIDLSGLSWTGADFYYKERFESTQADTKGLWHLDEGTGTTTADSSGNGNDGSLEPQSGTETLRPNAAGDYASWQSQYPSTGEHWDKVAEVTPDEGDTYIKCDTVEKVWDAYNLGDTSIPVGFTINSVRVYFRFRGYDGADYCNVTPGLRLGTSETTGTEISRAEATYATYSEILARPGGGSWAVSDLNSLQVRIGGRGYYYNYTTQVYVVVDYTLSPPTG